MTIRRTAQWQRSIDERILEYLRDESWSTPRYMAKIPGIHATRAQVRERCYVLADAELVAFLTEDAELVEITTAGKQYLDGEIDMELHPTPRHPQSISN
ncbi:hypothetical protein [Halosimplex halophilum]|uniref:hypothetical protein n=1 Tax=Halosimplex halophilum TaxID=2559572 RepID=UPI00107F8F02|nr:hypothetical protein [Halosimplex halophilum]